MDMFQIMGTIALNGASGVISDLNNVSSSAESTASAMQSAGNGVESANSGMSASFGSLMSSVQQYKSEGMSTSQAWRQATADMKGSTEGASNGMVSAFAKIGTAVGTYLAVDKLVAFGSECVNLWQIQETAELKLETIMKQRMGATDANVDSIKKLTSAQQELGVVGDEVQMSGAQQLATFLNTDDALATLIPAMNDLAVQQNGYNVTSENMVSIGNLMGKVMQGQTSALTRVGISFTEAQEEVLKYGTESEKASMLAQVITDNVGNMNSVLAQTDSGKIQQAKNRMGDLKEEVGQALMPAVGEFYEMMEKVYTFILESLIPAIQDITKFVQEHKPLIEGITFALGVLTTAIIAYNIAQNASAIATAISTGALTAFGSVMAFITSPITLVVLAIGALIAIGVLLYKNWDTIKAYATKIWNGIKSTISSVVNGIKSTVTNVWNSIKSVTSSVFNGLKSTVTSIWNGIKTAITNPVETAKNKVKSVVDAISGFFKGMKIELPKIKLPHFSVTGKLSIAPPSVPKLSIDWYKKAMDDPFMFTEPTLFDYNPLTGTAKGAGEAGDEVMIGKNTMLGMIQQAVASQNESLENRLNRIIDLLVQFFPDALASMNQPLVLDTGVLVSATAPAMNLELGRIAVQKGRGR